jgi:nitroimidazol reductase NimA-like FMN-containing flavoprotein (pyridoxamine 5'-phosphate oxidase superfamily)
MRRKDREVTGISDILSILDDCEVIRVGMCTDDMAYIVPMNFVYETSDEKMFIYLHGATEGRKMDMISKNRNVCFEADCPYSLIKSENACRWSNSFRSVMGEGTIEIVNNKNEKKHALDILMERYGFAGRPDYGPDEFERVAVFRISVSSVTGKNKM